MLTKSWVRNGLRNMDWLKRKGTTGKVEPCTKFLEEESFSFQSDISKFVSELDTPLDLVFNIDQSLLFYISPYKYKFDLKDSNTVPIKGADDKRQITAIFMVSALGSLLTFQLIYNGKTKR